MVKEIVLRVLESKPDDAGTGKARVSENILNALSLQEGNVIEVKGKRLTAATIWKALPDGQDDDVIRIDGLIRKNAEVTLNDSVTIRRADLQDARRILLASDIASLRPDSGFTKFIKYRFLRQPLIRGDTVLLDVLGTPNAFKVFLTEPTGIVTVCESTQLQFIPQRYSDAREILFDTLTYMRFRLLKEVEKKLGADYSRFRVPELFEQENEGEVLTEAKKRAKAINASIKVFVDLWENRGKIVTLEWAKVTPDSTVEYIYDFQKFKAILAEDREKEDAIDLLINALKDHEKQLQLMLNMLGRQIEAMDEKMRSRKE